MQHPNQIQKKKTDNPLYKRMEVYRDRYYDDCFVKIMQKFSFKGVDNIIVANMAPSILNRLANDLNSYGYDANIYTSDEYPYLRLKIIK